MREEREDDDDDDDEKCFNRVFYVHIESGISNGCCYTMNLYSASERNHQFNAKWMVNIGINYGLRSSKFIIYSILFTCDAHTQLALHTNDFFFSFLLSLSLSVVWFISTLTKSLCLNWHYSSKSWCKASNIYREGKKIDMNFNRKRKWTNNCLCKHCDIWTINE